MVRLARLLLCAALVMLASACHLEVQVGVDVADDGSGAVTVSVGLDGDAVGRVGGLDGLRQIVAIDDLGPSGWEVTGPVQEDDGLTWLRATKPFRSPEEATRILGEVAGGPFRDFSLVRERTFARTRYTFDGVVDLTGGLEDFGDEDLAASLDGLPLGREIAEIEAQFGATIDRLIGVRVAIRMPGAVESNAPGKAENGAVWRPSFADERPAVLHAESQQWRTGTLLWVAGGAVAALAFVLFALVLLALRLRRRRDRRRARGAHAAA